MKKITYLLFFIATVTFAQNTYVPDDNFEQALIDLGYDAGPLDDYVPTANINTITELNLFNKNISDLTGITDFIALTSLDVNQNQLTSLDISGNKALSNLNLNFNQLTSIDISNNLDLEFLQIAENKLTNLEVANNTKLIQLIVNFNQLTSLDISKNTKLSYINVNFNQLTSLNLKNGNNSNFHPASNFSNNGNLTCIQVDDKAFSDANWSNKKDATASYKENCQAITYTSIPDASFEQALIDLGYDTGAIDGKVPTENINTITYLYLDSKNITDLTGIEDFTTLTSLNVGNNRLTNLDLSQNTALTNLVVYYNQLKSIDISNSTNLNSLLAYSNQLTSLNVSNSKSLTILRVSNNKLTNIDISKNTALTYLGLSNNQLTNIDVTKNTALTELYINSNQLTNIDVSNSKSLTILRVSNNKLTNIDVSTNTALTSLGLNSNQLTTLDVSTNTALTKLSLGYNQLTNIDVTKNTALTTLFLSHNQLTTLDVSKNIALTILRAEHNQLTSLNLKNGNNSNFRTESYNLDFRNNPNLTCIQVDDKTFSNVNWSNNKDANASYKENCQAIAYTNIPDANFEQALIDLGYDTGAVDGKVPTENINTITSLSIPNKSIADLTGIEDFTALTQLIIYTNQLTSIDLSKNTALTELSIGNNKLTTIDLSNNVALTELNAYNTQLTSLDVSNNKALTKLIVSANQLKNIDISNNTNLTELSIANNQLTSLDVNNNINLIELNVANNQLTSLDVSNNTILTILNAANNKLISLNLKNGNNTNINTISTQFKNNPNLTCIQVDDKAYSNANWFSLKDNATSYEETCQAPVTYTSIPDTNFEQALIDLGYDTGAIDGKVPTENINTITRLNVFSKDIVDLTGIEDFKGLNQLDARFNQLTSINLADNLELEMLFLSNNQLTSINLSNNKKLKNIYVNDNNLISLNIKNGNNTIIDERFCNFKNNSELTCILVDNKTHSDTYWSSMGSIKDATASYEENCGADINSFTENTSGTWNDANNWSLGTVPSETDEVIIPATANVTINTHALSKKLTVNGTLSLVASTLTIAEELVINGAFNYNASASLLTPKASGTGSFSFTRDTYEARTLNAIDWYVFSLPLNPFVAKNIIVTSTLASGTGANKGLASYNNNATGTTGWNYYNENSTDNLPYGNGYAVKMDNVTHKKFSASKNGVNFSLLHANLSIPSNKGSKNGWNLLGNPNLASIAVNNATRNNNNFLAVNGTKLDPEYAAVYMWNPTTSSYDVINNAYPSAKYIRPITGFFVKVNQREDLAINNNMLSHQLERLPRIANTDASITLSIEEKGQKKSTSIKYLNNATNGLDVGYDAGLFTGAVSKKAIYTKLVSEDKGTPFALQCLAKDAIHNSSVPVGIKAPIAKEINIKAHSNNLPKGIRILLEDKQTNTITDLTDANSSYTVTLATKENNSRFYLHTTAKALSTEEIALDKINVVKLDANTLQLKELKDNATVSIYNVQGKLITNQKATVNATKVRIPSVATGVYLVTIKTATQQTTQKIIL
ncbi:conserved protein of unknown function precursor containing a T9SS type A C-terminal secretion signal [Tenacibaculum sp. 190524A02b]|uniref:T9SS type A sorting domain-containing protein n=1 Tax=Tenacibaculum vairaonense TaxID=3137860 RepID=UPI0032B27CAC